MDFGHYERFLNVQTRSNWSITMGKVFKTILDKERRGDYLGKTIQVVPHVTNEIKEFLSIGADEVDFMLCEIGGTVGDIESLPFLEAIRQISLEAGRENCLFIHVTLVPYIRGSEEHKSKPTQHSVKELRAMGISPDIIIARADDPIGESIKAKISLFCNVKRDCVIENLTLPCLYEAPLMLHDNGLDNVVCRELKLDCPDPDLNEWREMVADIKSRDRTVKIAMVGKYTRLHDAYRIIQPRGKQLGRKNQNFMDRQRAAHPQKRRRNLSGRRRHPNPRRIRRQGHRGYDFGGQVRPRKSRPAVRYLSRNADYDHRIRQKRLRLYRCQLR